MQLYTPTIIAYVGIVAAETEVVRDYIITVYAVITENMGIAIGG